MLMASLIVLCGCCHRSCQCRGPRAVPLGYCIPSPLPYERYCGCPTPIAEAYNASVAGKADPVVETELQKTGDKLKKVRDLPSDSRIQQPASPKEA